MRLNPDTQQLEYPCPDFMIKVMGENSDEYRQFAISTLASLCDEFMGKIYKESASKNGSFISLSFMITAKSPEHLVQINTALRQDPRTKMVI